MSTGMIYACHRHWYNDCDLLNEINDLNLIEAIKWICDLDWFYCFIGPQRRNAITEKESINQICKLIPKMPDYLKACKIKHHFPLFYHKKSFIFMQFHFSHKWTITITKEEIHQILWIWFYALFNTKAIKAPFFSNGRSNRMRRNFGTEMHKKCFQISLNLLLFLLITP
jgi:hypothetical protein